MNSRPNTFQNKRLIVILITATILLCLPFIAMQLTHEVNWTAFDFAMMGILLFGTGLIYEFLLRKVKKIGQRVLDRKSVV